MYIFSFEDDTNSPAEISGKICFMNFEKPCDTGTLVETTTKCIHTTA
jgi:hypothetical protein